MNRKYTRSQYLELVGKLREEIPEISITTDIIVGFPGETEEDFERTLDVARVARFDGAFMFNYSPRADTPAAAMDGQISAETKRARFDRLNEVVDAIVLEKNVKKEGEVFRVLCDDFSAGKGIVSGRTDGNVLVHFLGGVENVGKFVDVRITDGKPYYLLGSKC